MPECPGPNCKEHAGEFGADSCGILNSAYVLAGLAMMLNIRLSYSSAPYALIRFKLPENLFSVFVRRMASALELWCLPSMLLGNIMDLIQKGLYNNFFLTKTLHVLKDKAGGQNNQGLRGKAGELYTKAEALKTAVGAGEGSSEAQELMNAVGQDENSGIRQALAALATAGGATDLPTKANTVRTEYSTVSGKFGLVQNLKDSAYKDKGEAYGNVESAWNDFNKLYKDAISPDKYYITVIPSIICQWLNFLTYVILLVVYVMGGDQGHLTLFYFVIAISGVVFGINMTLVYAVDWQYTTVYIAGENCFPALTSFIHYITTLMFGNRRKWNSDFIVVCVDIVVAIVISFAAAVMWTLGYVAYVEGPSGKGYSYGHIHAEGFGGGSIKPHVVSPFLMIVVGMGLVYAIYPGIAPGMIVPFYLIDKIEMVLLVATIFPPMIVVILQITDKQSTGTKHSPKFWQGWGEHSLYYWHLVDLLIVIKITLASMFIYSLHYKESSLSRSIINQPKMSTFLSITFYMCHEFLLAIGFAGQISNGPEYVLIPQYIGALFMIFLAFYSEGYIIEYKSHDPAHWPTEGMTWWNAFCYWCKRASKITNLNLISLFRNYLLRGFVFFLIFSI
ncbi:Tpr-related protein family member, putative [Theileria annulata]|uniref:Tpr-related protein family member, putative n=1 Tax=Theileria annulata TaxID=5874 RepID=Q4UI40_THEAN|nr:Tpr-related protein family member, putative [Theileria annulata]CAI73249.1 Tpr-related protein family member, putative [Theileria annulata]|eukprot:XP_953926.1 Tpr-related protein family member, putative [Theileria annulata]